MVIQQDVASHCTSVVRPPGDSDDHNEGNPGKRKPRPTVTRATARAVNAKSVAASQLIQPERRHGMICDIAYMTAKQALFRSAARKESCAARRYELLHRDDRSAAVRRRRL